MVSAITVLVAIVICACLWQHQNDLSKLKRRLAIVEKENLILAKALKLQSGRIDATSAHFTSECEQILNSIAETNSLTLEPAKPKMVPKSKPVNWKSFKSAAEKEAQEEA